jgi:TRAP-type C4-dicarboxylate transport system permease small subunit
MGGEGRGKVQVEIRRGTFHGNPGKNKQLPEQVAGRRGGAYELASFLGAVVTAFSLGYTQKRKGHIVVDILSETFSPAVKRVVDSVSYFITMIFFAIISWVICRWGLRIAASGEVSETLKIAYYPFILCVALGFAFLCLTLIMDFLSALLKKGGNPAS